MSSEGNTRPKARANGDPPAASARRWLRIAGLAFGLTCFAGAIYTAVREKDEFAKAIDALRDPPPLAVALVLASLFIGMAAGMEPAQLLKGFREGVGNVLGSIAMILGLGNMLGKMLEESGGAERIAATAARTTARATRWTGRTAAAE